MEANYQQRPITRIIKTFIRAEATLYIFLWSKPEQKAVASESHASSSSLASHARVLLLFTSPSVSPITDPSDGCRVEQSYFLCGGQLNDFFSTIQWMILKHRTRGDKGKDPTIYLIFLNVRTRLLYHVANNIWIYNIFNGL